MATYTYQAVNETGASVKGTIEADSEESAIRTLVGRGLIPARLTAGTGGATAAFGRLLDRLRPVKAPEMILFTTQFRTMLRAGVPMLTLLHTLETQTEDARLKRIVIQMRQDIGEGASLHEAFGKHPRVFSPLFCAMVRAGEASGKLPEVLDRLIHIIRHEHKVRSDIRSALQYPMIVIGFLAAAFFILLTYVIPKFANIFTRSGIKLPLLTRICIELYSFLAAYWWLIIIVAIAAALALVSYQRTPQGRLLRDRLLLRLPLVGVLFQKAAMSRFAGIFAVLQSSGVGVLESMDILSGTINNAAITQDLALISERLEEGRGISGPLRQSPYFTPIVINMVAIGEESGNLEQMLNEVSEHYDTELEYAMKRLSDSIGPILTLGLAVVIGFFALAIYMPMWELSTTVR